MHQVQRLVAEPFVKVLVDQGEGGLPIPVDPYEERRRCQCSKGSKY